MKRMNEVFELPLQTIFSGECFHVKSNPNDAPELLTDFPVNAWVDCHAINHVDELADALEGLLNRLHYEGCDFADMAIAATALSAYRGEK
jgi:hypothetical protein